MQIYTALRVKIIFEPRFFWLHRLCLCLHTGMLYKYVGSLNFSPFPPGHLAFIFVAKLRGSGQGELLASKGWRAGRLLNILQWTGLSSIAKNFFYPVQNVNSSEFDKPHPRNIKYYYYTVLDYNSLNQKFYTFVPQLPWGGWFQDSPHSTVDTKIQYAQVLYITKCNISI